MRRLTYHAVLGVQCLGVVPAIGFAGDACPPSPCPPKVIVTCPPPEVVFRQSPPVHTVAPCQTCQPSATTTMTAVNPTTVSAVMPTAVAQPTYQLVVPQTAYAPVAVQPQTVAVQTVSAIPISQGVPITQGAILPTATTLTPTNAVQFLLAVQPQTQSTTRNVPCPEEDLKAALEHLTRARQMLAAMQGRKNDQANDKPSASGVETLSAKGDSSETLTGVVRELSGVVREHGEAIREISRAVKEMKDRPAVSAVPGSPPGVTTAPVPSIGEPLPPIPMPKIPNTP